MLLWWGSQRLCSVPSEREEAQNMCHFAAVETIQDVTTFCRDFFDTLHTGLSWYATYFLFQASVVLSIHHLRPLPPLDSSLAAVNQELWFSSISRARDCLASLGPTNNAAMRCLAVLDRIRDRSPPGQPAQIREYDPGYQTQEPGGEMADTSLAPLAVDPTLQVFFEDTSWENDLFEGLNGFPSTDEVDLFDYVGNTGHTMP